LIIVTALVFAVNEKGDWPWSIKPHGIHDALIKDLGADELADRFICARITMIIQPAVKYVSKVSSCSRPHRNDDLVVGKWRQIHDSQFGRRSVTGWDGLMMEMAKRIGRQPGMTASWS
jgi:hypothetical protein